MPVLNSVHQPSAILHITETLDKLTFKSPLLNTSVLFVWCPVLFEIHACNVHAAGIGFHMLCKFFVVVVVVLVHSVKQWKMFF